LFTCWAWPTHLYALVPLARACAAAGHEVRVASQPALRETVAAAGLPAVAVGRDVDVVPSVRGMLLPPAGSATQLPPPPAAAGSAGRPRALTMLHDLAEAMASDLAELAVDWAPELLVFEATTLAGPVAAAVAGIPAVRHLYGTDLLWPARKPLAALVQEVAGPLGGDRVDPLGGTTIDPCPPGLQAPTGYRPLRVRYTPYQGTGFSTAAPWLARRGPRPRVCVSWGTTIARVDPARLPVVQIAQALGDAGVEVVVAVTHDQAAGLGPLPDGVRLVTSAPLPAVLDGCDALVGHGGSASILTALSRGLPALLVPQLPDHAGHARRVAAAGAAIVLTVDQLAPAAVRAAVWQLLAEPGWAAAARELRRQLRRQPPPAGIVDRLTGLTASQVSSGARPECDPAR
jgi:UDP:flavonoid glycosyltransferase YjiC (YdhE family)